MGLYKYLASSGREKPTEVLIEADNQNEALSKLRSRRLIPIQYLGEASMNSGGKLQLFGKGGIDTFAFTRQLSPLLSSYIPLERALAIIAEGSEDPRQKSFVNNMRQGLHEGKKFSELIRSQGSLFPDYYANLIESGEESGCLPEVLVQLYKFMGETRDLKGFIVSNSIYPSVILSIVLIVVILLFTIFVPKFATIFADMGRETPPSLNRLLAFSAFAKWAWWIIPLLIVGGCFAYIQIFGKKQFDYVTSKMKLKIPLIGRIISDLEMCRYIRTLSIMTMNHVEIIRTVKIAGRIIHNPVVAEPFQPIADKLKSGQKLSATLQGNPFVPRETVPMLRVGEESGNVGDMLVRIADNLESDTRAKIKRLLSLFEPAVILLLASVVLIVVVSIFQAMMDLNAVE